MFEITKSTSTETMFCFKSQKKSEISSKIDLPSKHFQASFQEICESLWENNLDEIPRNFPKTNKTMRKIMMTIPQNIL